MVRAATYVVMIAHAGLVSLPGALAAQTTQYNSISWSQRDSSGIRILESALVDSLPVAFGVELRPFISLGGLSDRADAELDGRQPYLSATELNDANIVVNDGAYLKFFDRSGKLRRVAGRRGAGPGEFLQAEYVCRLRGDTLLVVDGPTGKPSLWSRDGMFLRALPRLGYVPPMACWPDGSTLVREIGGATRNARGVLQLEYVRRNANGSAIATYGRFLAPRYANQVMHDTWLVPMGEDLMVGEAESLELRRHRAGGELHTITRVNIAQRRVTDSEWHRMTEDMIPPNVVGDARTKELARLLAFQKPEFYPAHARLRVDPAHRTWIEDYNDRGIQYVFDSTGIMLGTVNINTAVKSTGRVSLVGVGSGHVVIRWVDSDGAAKLTFHRLIACRQQQPKNPGAAPERADPYTKVRNLAATRCGASSSIADREVPGMRK